MAILYKNAKVYTMERERGYTAFTVEEGRISALYTPQDPLPNLKEVVDLAGRTVLPGLIDSHLHFISSIAYTDFLPLFSLKDDKPYPTTFTQLCKLLAGFTAGKSKEVPLIAYSYVPSVMEEKRLPTREELDRYTDGACLSVITVDGHASSHSTKMLQLLGIESPPDGVLSGPAHEEALSSVTSLILKNLRPADMARQMATFVNRLVSYGITCCCCLEGFSNEKDPSLSLFARFAGRLPIDIRFYPQMTDLAAVEAFTPLMSRRRVGGCGRWEIDGSVGAKSAAFFEPFLGEAAPKEPYLSQEALNARLREADSRDFSVTVHAIGTRACEMALQAYEPLCRGGNPRRHRIDHFEFSTLEQAERCAAMGLYVAAQPGYAWYDEKFFHSYKNFLPAKISRCQIPLSVLAKKHLLLGSSDSPVQSADPFLQLQGMVDFPLPQYRLSLYEAFETYTLNAARALGEEAVRGSLAPGKKADFIVFEQDPFSLPFSEIHSLKPVATYIDGKRFTPMSGSVLQPMTFLLKKAKLI